MASVVFLCYHGIGHINPCFPLARLLEQQSHMVTIATVAHFKKYITSAGFAHYPLKSVPFGMGFESWVNDTRKTRFRYWADLKDRYNDQLYRQREQELTSLVTELKPDVIFVDGTQATDFIVLYPLLKQMQIACAMLHAMFPTHVLPGRPPVNSLVIPGNSRIEEEALVHMRRKMRRTDLRQRLMYFGISDRYIISRRLRRNQIPDHYTLKLPSLFDFQVADVPAFILAPRQFDFPEFDNPAEHHYVGFMQHTRNTPADEKWMQLKSSIEARRAKGSRLVYCSFGTVDAGNAGPIESFIKKLGEAIEPQDLLVVSLGGNRPIPDGLERDNVWVFPTVPQTELLLFADVFVTHGGLGSIREAIDAVVPMLMIVAHHQFDPPGNAARIQYHGLGIVGDLYGDAVLVGNQLKELMNDSSYKDRIRKLKDVNQSITPGIFLSQFNSLLRDRK